MRAVSARWAKPRKEVPPRTLAAFCAGFGAFFVYLFTLAPTVATNDAGRFQVAAPVLGTGHPTGYPTFILLGKLFTYLPFGDVAYRMNLMAAVFGGIAVALFVMVAGELGSRTLPALGAALLFGLSTTFWSQATFAEVYTMHAAFVLGVTYLLLLWRRSVGEWYVVAAALLYGVSLGNNAGMILLAPAYAVLLIAGCWRRLSVSLLGWTVVAGLVGLSVYLYVPIRGFAGAWHNYGDPVHNWTDVWRLISGARFQGLMGGTLPELAEGVRHFASGLTLQLPHPFGYALAALLVVGGLYGARATFERDRAVASAMLLALVCTLLYSISYQIDDIEVYYIPVYLFLTLLLAVGTTWLVERNIGLWPVVAVPLVIACASLFLNYSAADKSDYYAERVRAEATMARLPENAILYGKLSVVPLTYLREVEGVRRDVTLRWLDGGTEQRHLASDIRSGRPVYFISDPRYNEEYLEGAKPYATPREEDGLIRLLPRR